MTKSSSYISWSRSTSAKSSSTANRVSVRSSPKRLISVLGLLMVVAAALVDIECLTGSHNVSAIGLTQRLKTPSLSDQAMRFSRGEKASCVIVDPGLPAWLERWCT